MKQALSLLWLDVQMKLKRALAFRANFALNLLSSLFFSFVLSVFQFFVFAGVEGFPGWSAEQLLLFQATLVFWTGVTDFLFGGVRQLIDLEVQHGHFDRFFLWPAHPLVSLLTRGCNIYALASVLSGLVGVVVMGRRLDISPGPLGLLLGALFFLSGLVLYVSLIIVYCACTLFWVKMERLREVLDRVVFFGSFPADVYFGAGKATALACFPIALWVHLPVQALLGRATWPALGAVVTSLVLFALSLRFWAQRERLYVSGGG
jgi:ABC-2 type transport system permease protein